MCKEIVGRLILEAGAGMHGEEAKIIADAWVEMANRNTELLAACEAFIQYDQGNQEDGIALMISYNDALTKCKAALANSTL